MDSGSQAMRRHEAMAQGPPRQRVARGVLVLEII